MEKMHSTNHRLLIQKLLVSIHYLTLFRDEIILVEKTPSLLGDSFSPFVVQSELGEILAAIDLLRQQEKLIKSTFWYDEVSFNLMNHSLEIVHNWILGIDNVLETCESKFVFQAILGDNRQQVFGILIDVFTSIKITNLSLQEESDHPILVDTLRVADYADYENQKDSSTEDNQNDIVESNTVEEISNLSNYLLESNREHVVKQLRHYLFDQQGLIYVIDAKEDLKHEVKCYNIFNRFKGVCNQLSDSVIVLEEILEKLENRTENATDKTNELQNSLEENIYLFIYGQNILAKDNRCESLLEELGRFLNRSDLQIFSYKAYTDNV